MENTEPKIPSAPIKVTIHDTDRVKAALNLSEAIKDLARVIAGNVARVEINDCHIESCDTGIIVETVSSYTNP